MDALSLSNTSFLVAKVALVALVLLPVVRRARARKDLPPGPPLDPIIGGLRSLPTSYPWLTLAEWGQKWGTSNRRN